MNVKYSKSKKVIETIVYWSLVFVMIYFYKTMASNIFEKSICSVFSVLFFLVGLKTFRSCLENQVIYEINESGITDFTKSLDPLHLSWNDVKAVSISNQNYTANVNVTAALYNKDGELFFVNLFLDGMNYSRKQIFSIYDYMHEIAIEKNPSIAFKEAKGIREASVIDCFRNKKQKAE